MTFGDYGIQALEHAYITNRQIESARIAINRHIKRGGKVWINIFPDRPLKVLAADHPLFECFYQVGDVQYRDGNKLTEKRAPYLLGMNVGCRTAVIMSPFDLSCGWDGHPDPGGEQGPTQGLPHVRRPKGRRQQGFAGCRTVGADLLLVSG